jgi:hypothetical protein
MFHLTGQSVIRVMGWRRSTIGQPAEFSAQCGDLAAGTGFQQPDQAISFGRAAPRTPAG